MSWDALRQQMRRLENDIDVKLVAFSKVGGGPSTNSSASSGSVHHPNAGTADTSPLLGEGVFSSLNEEIADMLADLTDMNDRLLDLPATGAAAEHNRQRHRDILNAFRQEFRKIDDNHRTRVERESLLHGGGSAGSSGHGLSRRDMYLKENQHVHNSHALINDQISIAMETRDHLDAQRQNLRRTHGRFNDMAHRFPVINSLVQRINIRKRRDSLILGTVIGVCTILTILYLLR